ncbi:helix-turn-helix domain-containing protein [Sutcliffiella horikoshii]|uniref:helix-turn-helix domain-containing protein n=1 Tax=Sutcliffiella horikoshii TaxID=79883 RepID=UPI0038502E3D
MNLILVFIFSDLYLIIHKIELLNNEEEIGETREKKGVLIELNKLDPHRELNRLIFTLRNKLRISGKTFADQFSISNSYLSQIENNKVKAKPKTYRKIINGLNNIADSRNLDFKREFEEIEYYFNSIDYDGDIDQYSFNNFQNKNQKDECNDFINFLSEHSRLIFRLSNLYSNNKKNKEIFKLIEDFVAINEKDNTF